MRKQSSNPYQTSFGHELETVKLPSIGLDADAVMEASLTVVVPQHVPVYTVALRRSDVASLENRTMIRSPADAAILVRDRLQDADREHFMVLMLDTKNRVIGVNTVSIGILDSALVHPREVFKPAILCNASSVILAHNHPSGDPSPSMEDQNRQLNLTIWDHKDKRVRRPAGYLSARSRHRRRDRTFLLAQRTRHDVTLPVNATFRFTYPGDINWSGSCPNLR